MAVTQTPKMPRLFLHIFNIFLLGREKESPSESPENRSIVWEHSQE